MPDSSPPEIPVLIAGPPFSGKTTCGRIAAADLGMPFLDLDGLVEAALGCTIEKAFCDLGEEAFRDEEAAALEDSLAARPACLVALGGGALLRRSSLDRALAGSIVVTLTADREELAARLSKGRPLAGDAAALLDLLARRAAHYESLPNRIDGTGLTIEQCAAGIVRVVRRSCPAGRG